MKRILTLFLLILTILIFTSCESSICSNNPFDGIDELRNNIICGEDVIFEELGSSGSFSNPYIVSFKEDVSLNDIYSVVKEYNYELLSNSYQRVFLIDINNIDDFNKVNGRFISFIQKDINNRYSLAENDSQTQISESYNFNFEGFDQIEIKSDIVIAVLDSGVNRNHIALDGVNILDGYDSVAQVSGVYSDNIGHGTSVIGLLSATKGNASGVVGLLRTPTILPIKVTDDNGDISSSDFIRAIYYAADSGAKIINMSFCGSEYIEAEQQAINYAFAKGCILISASGNFSKISQYQNVVTYPSCYEHVIGVSSINENGHLSDFSFFNDNVDITALGEGIKVISGVTDKAVITADGTSFSAPYISALATLILSNLEDGVNINSDEMAVLLRRNAIDIDGVLCVTPFETFNDRNNPIICGIEDGKTYFENVIVTFNHGKVFLDGKEITSNTKINYNGSHSLVVVYNEYLVQYLFTVDNIPLEYDCPEGNVFHEEISITFDRGTATLNGEPYYSGKIINKSGHYHFVLTGPYGNKVEKTFSVHLELPEVIGLVNNATYTSNASFKVLGHGKAFLNGVEIEIGEQVICDQNGEYILVLTNLSGAKKVEYRFYIEKPPIQSFPIPVEDCMFFIDEENRIILLSSADFNGIRIYSLDDLTELKRIVSIDDKVSGIVAVGSDIFCWTDNKLFSFSRDDILNNEVITVDIPVDNISDVSTDGENLFIINETSLYIFNAISREIIEVISLSDNNSNLVYFDALDSVIIYNDGSFEVEIYSVEENSLSKYTFTNKIVDLMTDGEFLFSNGVIYDSNLLVYSFVKDFTPRFIADGYLISDNLLYNIKQCRAEGLLENEIISLFETENTFYIYYSDRNFVIYPKISDVFESLNGSEIIEEKPFDIVSNNIISSTIKLSDSISVHQWVYNKGFDLIYFIEENTNVLYSLSSNLQTINKIYLKDTPSFIYSYNDKVIVFFKTLKEIYCVYNDHSIYQSIDFELGVDMIVGDDRLFALSGGVVYKFFEDFTSEIFIDREDIISIGYSDSLGVVFASTIGGKLFKFDAESGDILAESSCPLSYRPIICKNNNVIVGNNIIDGATMLLVGSFNSDVFDINSTYFLLNKQLININNSSITEFPIQFKFGFLDNDSVYCYTYDNQIIKYHNSFGVESGNKPTVVIDGIYENDQYIGDVKVYYDFGYGYIDGHPFDSGATVVTGGVHRITIVLPYGQIFETFFTIDTSIKSIEIVGPAQLRVNESVSLRAELYPFGAKEEDIIFSSISENISITDDGSVLGLKQGIAEIICSTIDGRVVTSYSVEVLPYEFTVSNDRFSVDLSGQFLLDVPCYMRSSELLRFIKFNHGKARIVDRNNEPVKSNGYLSSGMKLEILNAIDECVFSLTIALEGDIDGDGYVSVNDYLLLGRHIYKTSVLEGYHLAAADVTSDGKVNISDLLKISSHLLNKSKLYDNDRYSVEDPNSSFIFYDTDKPLKGEKFKTTVYFTNSKAEVIKGRLRFDKSKLSFVSLYTLKQGWHVDIFENGDYIDFLVYNQSFKRVDDHNSINLVIDFIVNENINVGESTPIELVNVSSEFGLAKDSSNNITIKSNFDSTLLSNLVINNGEIPLNFKYSILKYWVYVPFNVTDIDLMWTTLHEEAKVQVIKEDLIVGTNVIKIIVTNGDDSTEYELYVVRDSEDKLSTESRAKDIRINAGTISPVFSSDVFKYYIILDNDTDITFEVDLIDGKAKYNVLYTEFGYTIQCIAENGDISEYKFEKEILYDISRTDDIVKADKYWVIVIILITFALGGIVSMLLLIKRSKKD